MNPTDEELKQKLTPEQYHVLREKGTEPAFSGKLIHSDKDGFYRCAVYNRGQFLNHIEVEPQCISPPAMMV